MGAGDAAGDGRRTSPKYMAPSSEGDHLLSRYMLCVCLMSRVSSAQSRLRSQDLGADGRFGCGAAQQTDGCCQAECGGQLWVSGGGWELVRRGQVRRGEDRDEWAGLG